MKRRINIRLSIIALIAIIATTLVTTLAYYNSFQDYLYEDLKEKAHILMRADLTNIKPGNLRVTWIDRDGTVLFDNDNNATSLANHLDRPEIQQAINEGEGKISRQSKTMGKRTFYYATRCDDGTILRVSTKADAITGVLYNALPVIGLILVLVLAICALIGHMLTRHLMRPIKEMAENLDDSSFTPKYKELEPFADKIKSQHEKVLSAAKSRQDFTANVTHELKTPITAISGYAELIEAGLADTDSQVHIAKQIRSNADRLLAQITDIIQLSELDHNEIPRNFQRLNLFEIAENCVKNHALVAEKKGISLSCSGTSAGINGDPNLIGELMDNLIQNAIRYNRENGKVEVKVCIEEGHPILYVKDTGIGIAKEHQERIFQRFYRVDKSRSRETGGTGLGLAIVKHIAEIHSAEVTVKSESGQGSVFIVKF